LSSAATNFFKKFGENILGGVCSLKKTSDCFLAAVRQAYINKTVIRKAAAWV
jgi:hypothetical protein